ncbi:hypothetical protein CTRI78_v007425 [Colletotrichum trifolii]|uniref:Proteophosphoglycan ppg4 n=1 Tax=Colletotrichum trifolii TaxID=5466 RepID=A0A4R8R677_COLTR|nr:hypothetical protein CTRI78_v007425 [Colletotrichum trifolii]
MSYESRRLLNLSEDLAACEETSILSDGKFEVYRDEVSQTTWKSSNPHQTAAASAQVTRANSEVSLYAPVRRRSMVQTPGLATRIPVEPSVPTRSSLRRSLPDTPVAGRSRLNSIESTLSPISPLDELVSQSNQSPELLPSPVSEPVERALTPSDMDYRPLGAMKFGSLRITNGAASPLPSPELEPPLRFRAISEPPLLDGTTSTSELEIELDGTGHNSSRFEPIYHGRTLQVSPKHTAIGDGLVGDALLLEYSAEVLTVRNDPNAKPSIERLQAEQTWKPTNSVARADSGIVANPSAEAQPKLLSKADSGYSSNVSLRSFHAKQPGDQKDLSRNLWDSLDPSATSLGVTMTDSLSHISPEDVSSTSNPLALHLNIDGRAISCRKNTIMASTPHNDSDTDTAHVGAREPNSSTCIRAPGLSHSGDITISALNSTLSIGSGSQRIGRFQRFIGSGSMRGPPSVHTTHPADERVPSIPKNVQTQLEEHSERFPVSTKSLTLRARASKERMKTITSAGSGEAGQAEDLRYSANTATTTRKLVASSTSVPGDKPKTSRRFSFHSSLAQAAASVIPRRSIQRKPFPPRTTSASEFVKGKKIDESEGGHAVKVASAEALRESIGGGDVNPRFTAHADASDGSATTRAIIMCDDAHRSEEMHSRPQGQMPPLSSDAVCLPTKNVQQSFNSFDCLPGKKKSPPISLLTRSGNGPRSLVQRPQSTTLSDMGQARRQALSRQNSREAIQSYPAASPIVREDALSAPPIPPMSPMRAMMMFEQDAQRPHVVRDEWRPANRGFDVTPGHNPAAGIGISDTHSGLQPRRQLRHRASCEGDTHQHGGPVVRGLQFVDQPPSQGDSYYREPLLALEHEQWEQETRQKHSYFSPDSVQPGLSRSRSRSRSVHANGNTQYRVLHSYNSPAYRHAPIWG